MSVRYVALCAAAAFVLAIGVHLFVQVHATPARAAGAPASDRASDSAASADSRGSSGAAARPGLAAAAAPADKPAAPFDPGAHVRGIQPQAADAPAPSEGDDDEANSQAHKSRIGITRPDKDKANPKLDAEMLEANKAYDRGDVDEAKEIAKKILAAQPANVRMLRILVSASCIDGDAATAKQYYATLPKADQGQMQTRCARYGVTFGDPAQ